MSLANAARKKSYPQLLYRLWGCLSSRRRKQFLCLLVLMVFTAIAEIVSIGTVIPFLSILASPDKIYSYPVLSQLFSLLPDPSKREMLFFFTSAFALAIAISGLSRILSLYVGTRLSFSAGADISQSVYHKVLSQPYSFHIGESSNKVVSAIWTKVNVVIFEVLLRTMVIISSSIILVTILTALVFLNPTAAISCSLFFGFSYTAIILFTKKKLKLGSVVVSLESTRSVRLVREGLGSIRDIIIDRSQYIYSEIFGKSDRVLRNAQASNEFISQCPRYAMEALGIVVISFVAFYIFVDDSSREMALPVFGALAFGAQKLLPVVQQLFSAWAKMRGARESFIDVLDFLELADYSDCFNNSQKLAFKDKLELESVTFSYDLNLQRVLENVSLTIEVGDRVGIIGASGQGKSTLLDLMMGLVEPVSGVLKVDGVVLNRKMLFEWRKNIAHVPQEIFLADASIIENVAFGVQRSEIDIALVQKALKVARLDEFVEMLPGGFDSHIGEMGKWLSGGQRQRIAIARAIYKNAKLLFFDEATSALDKDTEKQILEQIYENSPELTIVIIAHDISSLSKCNKIFRVANRTVKIIEFNEGT